MKVPFITKDQLDKITAEFPTPFHLYDEHGIREKARALNTAFSWNKGFKRILCGKSYTNAYNFENFARRRLWS